MRRIKQFCSDFFPEIMGVFVAIASLNIWLIVSIAIDEVGLRATYESIEESFLVIASTAIGAIAGSYFTFRYNKREVAASERLKRINAIHHVFLALKLFKIELNVINITMNKYKTPYSRGVSMPAYNIPVTAQIYLNLDELNFLSELKEYYLLKKLYETQRQYESVLGAIDKRNTFYKDQIEAALFANYNEQNLKYGEKLLNSSAKFTAIKLAKNMYDSVSLAESCIEESILRVRNLVKKIYPYEVFDES